jgi:uncharacterized membrane protein YjgN (DUF898 family)
MTGRIIFTGDFWNYFWMSLFLGILTILTLGLLLPYVVYWQFKYFFVHMQIQMDYQWNGQQWVPLMYEAR